jgi:flavin reductase (DIM6/NTAB) family NADH-FMN oxidoreductase RutF
MAAAPGAPDGARHPEAFKAAFRRLASGVCVVMFHRHGRPHGFTATSVTSVSMAPPMALFCVGTGNDSHPHLSVGTPIGISMLSAAQRTLSDRFAGKAGPEGYEDVETVRGPGGVLLLPGALAHLAGRVAMLVPAGDHSIIVCDLHAAASADEAPPLLHFSRAYHGLAPLPVEAVEPVVAKPDVARPAVTTARREGALARR